MSLDGFLPFYGNDFFQATEGRSDTVTCGYLRALWHYWHHEHCEGLDDDDEYLRKLCRIELQDWSRCKQFIFGKAFKLIEGRWHQQRAREEYQERLTSYNRKVLAIEAAREKKQHATVVNAVNSPVVNAVNKVHAPAPVSASDSDSDSILYKKKKEEDTPRELPPAQAGDVASLLAFGLEKFGVPPLDPNVQRIRANLAELLGTGYKRTQIEEVITWAKSPKAKAGTPQSLASATDPFKFSQWLTTMENHANEIAAEFKRRNR